ncbi:hypothetical protein PHAVU_006G000600 [Phaseolus vulgaris]|uniref:Bidirectional sugar transporter SWEET n=1 Tax=Phaseolus vulgaris TaxID=3885 RepID=V7BJ38_PHAVU|nr:hypothetical protein PHAVU_006G000600g [Phaseolus vulgaris]ESW17947.1 hypothetical protein PHAVU_006G000600g [Phaseolus vulgaris]
MVTADTIRTVVGIIGNIISGCLFLSPVPTFVEIWKKGSVEQYSAVPYMATLMNCMVWTLYGLPMVHPHSFLVVSINGGGCVIEMIYVTLFFLYSHRTRRLTLFLCLFSQLIFLTLLSILTFTSIHDVNKRSAVVGTICVIFNVAMYASPLSVMKLVMKTKSVEYMPFSLSLASFGNGVAWTTYSLIPFDPFMAIPNGIGTTFSVAQLILYATYYKSTKRQITARNAKGVGEVNLSEVVVGNNDQDPNNINKIGVVPHGL